MAQVIIPDKQSVLSIDNDKRKNVMQCILDGSEYQDAYKNKTEETIIEKYEDISKFINDKHLDDVDVYQKSAMT